MEISKNLKIREHFSPLNFFQQKCIQMYSLFKVFSKIIKISFCKCPIFYLEFITHMHQPALSSHQKHSDDACFSVWLHLKKDFLKKRLYYRIWNKMANPVFEPEHGTKVTDAKLLVVGAGGIGCELLKNLVLTGFKNITVVSVSFFFFHIFNSYSLWQTN